MRGCDALLCIPIAARPSGVSRAAVGCLTLGFKLGTLADSRYAITSNAILPCLTNAAIEAPPSSQSMHFNAQALTIKVIHLKLL